MLPAPPLGGPAHCPGVAAPPATAWVRVTVRVQTPPGYWLPITAYTADAMADNLNAVLSRNPIITSPFTAAVSLRRVCVGSSLLAKGGKPGGRKLYMAPPPPPPPLPPRSAGSLAAGHGRAGCEALLQPGQCATRQRATTATTAGASPAQPPTAAAAIAPCALPETAVAPCALPAAAQPPALPAAAQPCASHPSDPVGGRRQQRLNLAIRIPAARGIQPHWRAPRCLPCSAQHPRGVRLPF